MAENQIDFGGPGPYVWRAWIEDSAGDRIGAGDEVTVEVRQDPRTLNVSLGKVAVGVVRAYDGVSGVQTIASSFSGEAVSLQVPAGPGFLSFTAVAGGTVEEAAVFSDGKEEGAKPVSLAPVAAPAAFMKALPAAPPPSTASAGPDCEPPSLLVTNALASSAAAASLFDYLTAQFGLRLAGANPGALVSTVRDSRLAAAALKSAGPTVPVLALPPGKPDLVLGHALVGAADGSSLLEAYLVDAASGTECARWSEDVPKLDELQAGLERILDRIGPLPDLYARCGWDCWEVSFELEHSEVGTQGQLEVRTEARGQWEGHVTAKPNGALVGTGRGGFSFSRFSTPAPGAQGAPATCAETYIHDGDIEVALSGRRIGDTLRVGFLAVTRTGLMRRTCGGQADAFALDVAGAYLAPLGARAASLPARAGSSYAYPSGLRGVAATLKLLGPGR